MTTDYNRIAEDYKKSKEAPWRLHMEQYNFFRLLGDVTGRSVLDLACGEGHYTRRLKRRGAGRIVGVDISARMIELAVAEERARPLGIDYVVADAAKLQLGEPFDFVVASYLLNYAQSTDELRAMADGIARHLKPGGRFVTINDNPAQPPATYPTTRKYGFIKTIAAPLTEGTPITYTCFLDDGGTVQFDNYYLTPTTHLRVLTESGLRHARWHPLQLGEEGEKEFGRAYWQDFLTAQPVMCLDAQK
ncbi:methyltransferase type 11 [Planctomycetaceae bacterium SCGC AG-212-F19]|nr:methyltransferase type 11 [Planctomycetaceae bacterium SCGC AG-212-F19]